MNKLINRYTSLPLPVKAGLWFTICSFLQRGISFITVPIFTRILTTEQYGTVSVYNSWLGLITIFATLNLSLGIFNNGMIKYEKERNEFTSAMQGLVTVLTFLCFIIYYSFRGAWNSVLELSTPLVCVMFIEILASSALSFWSARQRFEYKYRQLVTITLSVTVLTSILSIIAVLMTDAKAESKILSNTAVVVIICGGIYAYNFLKGRVFYNREFWKFALAFNIPLLPHYLSTMVLNQSDRIMISKIDGTDKAGIYTVAYSAAMILNIFTTAINQSFAPWLYTKLKAKEYKSIAQVANMMFLLVAAVLTMLIAFAPECIKILASSEYYEAIWIIPPVASSLYFVFMYQIFANVEFYFLKNKFIMYASTLGAVLNIILNYIFIHMFGYLAAGYTTLACYIIFGISHYIFMKRICKEELKGIKLFDGKFVFAAAAVLMICTLILSLVYEYFIWRYCFIAVVAMVMILKRKYIINQFKKIKER